MGFEKLLFSAVKIEVMPCKNTYMQEMGMKKSQSVERKSIWIQPVYPARCLGLYSKTVVLRNMVYRRACQSCVSGCISMTLFNPYCYITVWQEEEANSCKTIHQLWAVSRLGLEQGSRFNVAWGN